MTPRALAIVSILAIAICAPPSRGDVSSESVETARRVHALEQQVAARPDDVDARLALASRLAWLGRRDDARREAREVVRRAPDYTDAYVLLARLSAWEHDYVGARAWLDALAARHDPDTVALLLRADTYIWEGRLDDARAIVDALPSDDLDVLVRQVEIEYYARNTSRAHELAGAVLAISPTHPTALAIFDDTRRFLVGIDSYVGRYPVAAEDQRLATGLTTTLVVFPRSHLSFTWQYELDHRFGTNNHRLSLRSDWRPTRTLTTTLFARAGWVSVVPAATVYAAIQWEPRLGTYLGSRYTVDVMSWPGQVHRLTAIGGLELGHHVRADVAASLGMLDYCAQWQTVRAFEMQLGYVRPRWQLGVKYAHGSELDRPLLPAFLSGMYGSDVCPASLGPDAALLAIQTITTDDVVVLPTLQLDRRSSIGFNYMYERRHDGASVHVAGIALRRSF